ncbi:MAG: capsid protein [Alphaproteobacteria bacterium]|nr:capsid protein [Alphaproteobacteria bacterium]
MDIIRNKLQNFLNIQPATKQNINIIEPYTFEACCLKNLLWYRGDSSELEQFYKQIQTTSTDKLKFWASQSTSGIEIRKIHTGLPSLIIDTLTSIVVRDFSSIDFDNPQHENIWKDIEKENNFKEILSQAIVDTLAQGDGAFKISFDVGFNAPIIEFYPSNSVDFQYNRGKIKEIVFKTPYFHKDTKYTLMEHYGYGYVSYELYKGDKFIPVDSIPPTRSLKSVQFDSSLMMAMPFMVFKSCKFQGRGQSVLDKKSDCFDSFDEIYSQWIDALRKGRTKTYIPDSLLPRDSNTGEIMKSNPFDNTFIVVGDNLQENAKNQITLDQPQIPHDSYLATYITALDLCLQGLISPSTLGIDTKKLDNAEAQREKEKTTLYTRNRIVETIQNAVPKFIQIAINSYLVSVKKPVQEVKCNINFGEYANPSFESQVETVGKAKTQGIMSIERCVEELYGDTLTDDEKSQEVQRLQHEQGITTLEDNLILGDINV